MRGNGKFPGGLVGRLGDTVKELIRLNSGDGAGDAFAKGLAPLVPRFDATHDWSAAEAVALLDDIAAISVIPLETALDQAVEHTFQRGAPLPAELAGAPWGEVQPSGLRMAWLLEPRAGQYAARHGTTVAHPVSQFRGRTRSCSARGRGTNPAITRRAMRRVSTSRSTRRTG